MTISLEGLKWRRNLLRCSFRKITVMTLLSIVRRQEIPQVANEEIISGEWVKRK